MWQYILYFLLGGTIVSMVAYLANHGNQVLTILMGNLPVLFMMNIFLAYRVGGTTGSMIYAKGMLAVMPFFIVFILITLLILPHINTPLAVLPAMLVYIIPPFLYYRKKTARIPGKYGNLEVWWGRSDYNTIIAEPGKR